MKKLLLVSVLLTVAVAELFAQVQSPAAENPGYNAELARQLGADDYGMKKYVIAFLKRGPTKLAGAEAEQLQNAHLKNIIHLASEGKLVVAGPFTDDGEVRGIFILNAETIEEAKEFTESRSGGAAWHAPVRPPGVVRAGRVDGSHPNSQNDRKEKRRALRRAGACGCELSRCLRDGWRYRSPAT